MFDFVGPSTVRVSIILWALGLAMLALELSFAFLLQQFLIALGLITTAHRALSGFHPTLIGVVLLILAVLLGRMAVGAYDVADADGLLGRDVLDRFNVAIDSAQGIVTLAPK